MDDSALVKKCIKGDARAQRALFEKFAPKMLGVCMRYAKNSDQAEDVLQDGFVKVFTKLSNYSGNGSLEGWIRRIMVNTCISYLRKKNNIDLSDEDYVFNDAATENLENTSVEDIQKLIDKLPEGYKMVFNLFAIEGYKHSEIAKKLEISESTSKSQLFKARKLLQQNYIKMNKAVHGDK